MEASDLAPGHVTPEEPSTSASTALAVTKFSRYTLKSTFTLVPSKKMKKKKKCQTAKNAVPSGADGDSNDAPENRPLLFEKFPPELRDRIYHFRLISDDKITATKCLTKDEMKALSDRKQGSIACRVEPKASESSRASLLLVNRQMYNETVAIFYSHNHFNFECAGALEEFLKSISTECRNYITEVTVNWVGGYDAKRAFLLLAKCEALKTLHLEISMATLIGAPILGWPGQSRQMFVSSRGMPSLLTVRGLKTVDFIYTPPEIKDASAMAGFEARIKAWVLRPRRVKTVKQQAKADDKEVNQM
ncbi:MAG: hypothetical protein M1812_004658 [Candelaria pacifica]|nr:MAG: hypothetical protein M1812_004658 [Candelaria pacifica]